MSEGYHLTYSSAKCSSVRTGVQADGAYEFLVNLQGGPGVERHLHGYAYTTPDGLLLRCGARVKDSANSYLGPAVPLSSNSTQELARFLVEETSSGLECRFTQLRGDEWAKTGPGALGGDIYRAELPLPVTGNPSGDEYRVLFYDRRSQPALEPGSVVMPFSSEVPFGMAFEPIPSSSSYSTHRGR